MKSASKRITQEAERGSIVQILVEWRMEWMPVGELRLHLLRRAGLAYSLDRLRDTVSLVLLAAFVSLVLSVVLWFGGQHDQGIFVGLWAPSILSLGAVVLPWSER